MEAIDSGASPEEAFSAAAEVAEEIAMDLGVSPEDFAAGKEEAQEAHDTAIADGVPPGEAMTAATDAVTDEGDGTGDGDGGGGDAAATAAAVAASTADGNNGVVEGEAGVEAEPAGTWGDGSEAGGEAGGLLGDPPNPPVDTPPPGEDVAMAPIPVLGDPDFVEAEPVPLGAEVLDSAMIDGDGTPAAEVPESVEGDGATVADTGTPDSDDGLG
jgi:hypothetical protein